MRPILEKNGSKSKAVWFSLMAIFALSACTMAQYDKLQTKAEGGGEVIALSATEYQPLETMRRRSSKINVAVYEFPDFTGQNTENDNFAELSKAVSQGTDAYVLSALGDVGGGTWFRVLERRFLEPVLQERRIKNGQAVEAQQRIRVQNERLRIQADKDKTAVEIAGLQTQINTDYGLNGPGQPSLNPDLKSKVDPEIPFSPFAVPNPLKNLKIARYVITGAVVAYDSDVASGGSGVRILNVGGTKQMRKDIITVNLRFADVSTSEILAEKTVTQVVESFRNQSTASDYDTHNTVLELEAGQVINEPRSFALDAALRLALSGVLQELERKNIF
jgi:curli biogenesis system outer membrane secretion channel CsgG